MGAVTHVLVNDPTRGYGIFIENMLAVAGVIGAVLLLSFFDIVCYDETEAGGNEE